MKIIDSKGRLFSKVSILDLGAALIILLVIIGIFFFPGTPVTQSIVAQTKLKPVEVKVLVRGLSVADFDGLLENFETDKKSNIIIRNQPAGEVEVIDVSPLPRTTPVPQPDGTVKALPDPRPEIAMIQDMVLTLQGRAEITNNGVVLDNTKKVKIGTPIQLEGNMYDFNGTIISVNTEV
ncbi:DUF4330 domain-containing protein [Myxosarcina sp. GI1]|uniref:DUF4330 domain-containing protein n=1 Tax=Myxosarcina sp. GI1 TaxID=1541065 RepID=UPI00055BA499|nr:DUF4330 domain-containing protein [Myxosarcina sp. GI1]